MTVKPLRNADGSVVIDASRTLLHHLGVAGQILKAKLIQRFRSFVKGRWIRLIEADEECDEKSRSRRRVHDDDDLENVLREWNCCATWVNSLQHIKHSPPLNKSKDPSWAFQALSTVARRGGQTHPRTTI